MTSNQIAWWNYQESIRSHMQNELNERNKNSITQSLGDESNRISNQRMENDFVLGKQGNDISQQQADTASRRATQDYDIGLKNVANTQQANAIKATDVANNYIIGQGTVKNQSIRNAQDFALGQMQQESNRIQANAAQMVAGTGLAKLNPGQIVVALAAPTAQTAVNKVAPIVVDKVVQKGKQAIDTTKKVDLTKSQASVTVKAPIKGQVATPRVTTSAPTSTPASKKKTTSSGSKVALKGMRNK